MIEGPALDTMVVDRAGPSRNPGTRALVNASRRRLMAGALPDSAVDDALAAKSARLALGHFAAIAMTIGLTALIGVPLLRSLDPALWGALAIGLCALVALLSRKRADGALWIGERFMQSLHLGLGVSWVWFVTFDCALCTGDAISVYRADALLVGMAVSALVHAQVRHALPLTFAPAVAAMIMHVDGRGDMVGMAMLGMTAGGLCLFTFIASRTRKTSLAAIRSEYEKDGLIAELETEKVASDAARRRAEEASLAKSRFLASMSHELRTPLNAILGFSEVMKDEVLGPLGSDTYREYAGDVHSSGQHLLSLINEILDLSRIEAGRYTMEPAPLSLEALATACVSTLRVKASTKSLDVRVRAAVGLPLIVADERAVRQVLLNLLSNAIKFTPVGGAVQVVIGQTAGGGQYVTVADNGPGIAENELPLVLSAFGQGSIAIKSAEQGTGLGLAIVQALVTMHGGRFRLSSRLREGTRATFTLPPSLPAGSVEPTPAEIAQTGTSPTIAPEPEELTRELPSDADPEVEAEAATLIAPLVRCSAGEVADLEAA